MGTDTNSLASQILEGQELIDGLRNSMPNFDDRVCTTREVDSLSGTIPYISTSDTLGRDGGAQAIGADPSEVDFNLSTLAYACVQYGRQINVPKAVVADLDQYMEALAEMALVLLENNAIAREADLAALLTDSSFNGQQAAGNGAWSSATSTPVQDMLNMKLNDVPKIDTVIIGATSAVELMVHPDITAMAGLSYASGGAIPTNALQDVVGKILGVDPGNVHIWDSFYNSANQPSTTLARVTGDFFWGGQKKGLLKLSMRGMQGQLSLVEGHTSYSQAVTDTCVHKRVDTYLGGEITGL